MNKENIFTIILLTLLLVFISCSSIYTDTPEVTLKNAIEVNPDEEYFTPGNIYSKNHKEFSWLYNDSWIYVETREYDRYVSTLTDGTKCYVKDKVARFVKYNPNTGIVSSLCLDPNCTHSPGSSCLMLIPQECDIYNPQGMVGDWFMFTYSFVDEDIGLRREAYVYNLKTGEGIKIFEGDKEDYFATVWKNRCVFGNKLYSTKNLLDYSNSGYDPAGVNPMSDFKPETKSYLGVYDFEQRKETVLFEVPANYTISAVTNKRFFFKAEDGSIYSCDHNGENMTKEKNLDFSPQDFCGTYAYGFDNEAQEIKIYDLRTDTVKNIPMEYPFQNCILCNEGIMFSTCSVSYQDYIKAKMIPNWNAYMQLRHDGAAWVYLMDFDGSNSEQIYENEDLGIVVYYASGDYLYAWVTDYDPSNPTNYNYMNSTRHIINRTTGEITPVPLLELVLVEE